MAENVANGGDVAGNEPLPLGTKVRPFGKIAAVGMRDGERWYGFNGRTAIMPAGIVESMYYDQIGAAKPH